MGILSWIGHLSILSAPITIIAIGKQMDIVEQNMTNPAAKTLARMILDTDEIKWAGFFDSSFAFFILLINVNVS